MTKPEVATPKGGLQTGYMNIPARRQDMNEIRTFVSMFSGSGKTERLMGILFDILKRQKSEMVVDNRK